jgi:hypothetical protein
MDDADFIHRLYDASLESTVQGLRALYRSRHPEGRPAPPDSAPSDTAPRDPSGPAADVLVDVARLTLQHYSQLVGMSATYTDRLVACLRSAKEPRPTERVADEHPGPTPRTDDLARALEEVELLVLRYPAAAQRVVAAFIAEGRRFAATAEGQAWRARLVESELVRRGRVFWESSALNLLQEIPETAIPSMLLDALVGAVASGDLTSVLGRLWATGKDDNGENPAPHE